MVKYQRMSVLNPSKRMIRVSAVLAALFFGACGGIAVAAADPVVSCLSTNGYWCYGYVHHLYYEVDGWYNGTTLPLQVGLECDDPDQCSKSPTGSEDIIGNSEYGSVVYLCYNDTCQEAPDAFISYDENLHSSWHNIELRGWFG